MKKIGLFLLFAFSLLTHNVEGSAETNRIKRIYIESEKLHFSDEGIFLQTNSSEWRQVNHINHDTEGYFLEVNFSKDNSSEDTYSKENTDSTWECPSCRYVNPENSGVCEKCLWPLFEWDW